MPLYDYKCPKCEHKEEAWVSISGSHHCTKCNNESERQISTPSFVLKGTGWYQTDFKNK